MVDQWVLNAQQWVNSQYGAVPGYVPAPENGKTGWPTMYSLTRALQHELGLSASQMSDSFGPTTLALVTSQLGNIGPASPQNIVTIVQCGLYCKGYDGSDLSQVYDGQTATSVGQMRQNMGFADGVNSLAPKEFKALLTMDAYVVVENGSAAVRSVQQWLNRTYVSRSWASIIPCDGHFSRDVQKMLVYALQEELAVAGANGNLGPGTRGALQQRAPLTVGSHDTGSSVFVRLFQAAMIFNGYQVAFDGAYSQDVANQVTGFQEFVALPVTSTGDYQTWASLLVSNGDPNRRGTACDTIAAIIPERGAALYQAGYRYIGRYLTNTPGGTLNKQIQPGELDSLFAAGLRVFPIYETNSTSVGYFTTDQGTSDAITILQATRGYGFPHGTTVYCAVDYDALDGDVVAAIIPYFQAIKRSVDYWGYPFRIGVYGPRNICSRLSAAGLTATSFVADLSTGFSGNLGFPMPRNWAFDQIATISVGSGSGALQIDNNIASGRDFGQGSVNAPSGVPDTLFNAQYRGSLGVDMAEYCADVPSNTTGLIHGVQDAIDVTLNYDTLITHIAISYGIRKALVQAEVFWEYWKQTPADPLADVVVESTYAWMVAEEEWEKEPIGEPPTPPLVTDEDASTGIAQIFAATAIRARNWAVAQGLIPGGQLDAGDWHVVWSVWQSLHDDGMYNIGTVPLVLFEGAAEVGVSGIRLDYTIDERQRIFARYNGTGPDAASYGEQLDGVYGIFERYNALSRQVV